MIVGVLLRIAPLLEGLDWALSGSAALKLHGLDIQVRDLDIQTTSSGAQTVASLLSSYQVAETLFDPNARWVRSRFIQFEVDGTPVDVMGDLEYRQPDQSWQPAPDFRPHIQWLQLEGQNIPVLSLEYLRGFYMQMRRLERVKQIRSHLLL